MAISHHVSSASLPDVFASYCQTTLVDESGMIRTQMGKHITSDMVTVLVQYHPVTVIAEVKVTRSFCAVTKEYTSF
jgi:hypothetical protein